MIDKRNDISSSQWMKKVSSKNDSFTRVHEDPILLIKQEEKKVFFKKINNFIYYNLMYYKQNIYVCYV